MVSISCKSFCNCSRNATCYTASAHRISCTKRVSGIYPSKSHLFPHNFSSMCRKRQACCQITHNDDDASDNVQIYIKSGGQVCICVFLIMTAIMAWCATMFFCLTIDACYSSNGCNITFMLWLTGILSTILSWVIFMMNLVAINVVMNKSHMCDECAAKAKRVNALRS